MKFMEGAAISALLLFAGTGYASATVIDIYDGIGGDFAPMNGYFVGQGYTVNNVGASFSSLSGANLAILDYPVGLTSTQLSAIDSYVSGGGRLIINSEGQGFEAGQAAVNSILTSLGSSIVNVDGAFDSGLNFTTNIVASPFTAGVTSIEYAYTSSLTGGTALVFGNSGQALINYQAIGSGDVFAIADTDTADSTSFLNPGNQLLYCDFGGLSCGQNVSVSPVPEPITLSLFGAGLAGAFAMRRKKKAA